MKRCDMRQQNTREAIVEAMLALVAEHGLEKTSLSMVAEQIGISKPAIYYYFPSKESLVDYIFDELLGERHFAESFPLDRYTKQNFRKRLVQDGLHVIEQYISHPARLRVVNEFVLSASRKDKHRTRLREVLQSSLDGFTGVLNHGVKLGAVTPGRTAENARMLALVIDGIGGYLLIGVEFDYAKTWEQAVIHATQ